MDNNNPLTPSPADNPAPTPVAPVATPSTPIQPPAQPVNSPQSAASSVIASSSSKGSNTTKIMMILGILVLVIVAIGGGYLYMTSQNKPAETQVEQNYDDLESEADSVDIGNVESDFAEVDTDLQSL